MAEPVRFRQVDQMLMDSFTSGELLECSQLELEQRKENSRAPATSPQVTSPFEKSSGNNISVEEIPPTSQPLSPPATPVEFGTSLQAPRGEPEKRNRVVQKLCQRIEQIQRIDNIEDTADEIFTISASSTPESGTIYQQAADRIISSEGLTGPSVVGVRRSEESQVQKEIENPVFLHEQIVKSWGLT